MLNDIDGILILSDDQTETEAQQFAALPPEKIARLTSVSASVLSKNIASTVELLSESLAAIPRKCGRYFVDEIHIALAVNGKGAVSLIGKLEAGVTATFTLKLTQDRDAK